MKIVHMVQDSAGTELSREVIEVPLRTEAEFESWLDEVRDGFAQSGQSDRKEQYWAITAQIPQHTHYWWSISPYDAS